MNDEGDLKRTDKKGTDKDKKRGNDEDDDEDGGGIFGSILEFVSKILGR